MTQIRKYSSGKTLASIFVLLSIVIILTSCYWYHLPEQTWENFLVALEQGDLVAANSYCDQISLKVEPRPGQTPDFQFLLRPASDIEWMGYFPIQSATLRKHYRPRATSTAKRLLGKMQVSNPGSIYFGHFEIHQNKICFVSDMTQYED